MEVDTIFKDNYTGLFLPDSARPQAKGYSDAGASHLKKALKAFRAQSGNAQEDIDWNNYTLRQRGRMLYMASPIATSAIKTNRTSIVGVGLQLKSNVDRVCLGLSPEAAKKWQRGTEAEFRLWAGRKQACDATGINNFYGMQQLALTSWLSSGDVFALFKQYAPTGTEPYGLRVHLIEADRVSTPGGASLVYGPSITEGKTEEGNAIYDGVEVDGQGKIVAYHICNIYPYQATGPSAKWERVLAYGEKTGQPNILQVMDSERCDQYRGITYLAQVIEPLLQVRRYTESELMAALVQSFFTAWITTEADPGGIPMNEVEGQSEVTPREGENEYSMGPAQVTHLNKGEEIVFGNPNIPTSGFDSFVNAIVKQIGAALEIPSDVLLKSFNASYSASRAALLEAWGAFKMRRGWFVDDFCQPVYNVWLAEAVARGRVKAPGFFNDPAIRAAWSGARWIGPVQGQLDPLKEAKAAVVLTENGFKTHEQVTVEMDGGDWEDNIEQLQRENKALKKARGATPEQTPQKKRGGITENEE